MQIGAGSLEINKKNKEPNIALANNEKKLNFYAKQSYHIQGLMQSKWGFWLSIAGAIIGFAVIIVSIFTSSQNGHNVGVISGTIIEVVSVLFFSISNKANERTLNSFDKLREDSNTISAIDLAKTVEDTRIKDELIVKLSLHLIGINEENICKYTKSICMEKESDKTSI